jgi:hypothetical protein
MWVRLGVGLSRGSVAPGSGEPLCPCGVVALAPGPRGSAGNLDHRRPGGVCRRPASPAPIVIPSRTTPQPTMSAPKAATGASG